MPADTALAYLSRVWQADPLTERSSLRSLTSIALDAARQAGAAYADVRIRSVIREQWGVSNVEGAPAYALGSEVRVRAAVGSAWGITGVSGAVTPDDMARLGRDAAGQARIASVSSAPPIALAPSRPVADGDWVMPIQIDPFRVSAAEKMDVLSAMNDEIVRVRYRRPNVHVGAVFVREHRTVASTDGSFCTQTVFNTSGQISMNVWNKSFTPTSWIDAWTGEFLTPAGAGWEYLLRAPYRDHIQEWIDVALRHENAITADVGRHDIVFDALATASLLDATIGVSTEVERAMGIHANDLGVSFLDDPIEMIGSLAIASPRITVTANRSLPQGAATVQWDDEGVAPRETVLVRDGVLADMQTTREGAMWLAPVYQREGRSAQSNGCAGYASGPAQIGECAPNLALSPGKEDLMFEDLIKNVKTGYAVLGGPTSTDWQALNGASRPRRLFKIRDGQLEDAVRAYGVELLVRTPDVWKSVAVIGGARSARAYGIKRRYEDVIAHTVSAVPILVPQVRLANWMRT